MLQLLEKLRQVARQQMRERLDCLFEEADGWLMDEMDACRDSRVQQHYAEMMRLLKRYRSQFNQGFLRYFNDAFDQIRSVRPASAPYRQHVQELPSFASLSLVGHEEMSQSVALDTMAARCRSAVDLPLRVLQARIQALFTEEHPTSATNPFDPKFLSGILGQAVVGIPWEIHHELIFFKLFQRYVLTDYAAVIASADSLLQEAGILSHLSEHELLQKSCPAYVSRDHDDGDVYGSQPESPPSGSRVSSVADTSLRSTDVHSGERDLGRLLQGSMARLRQPSAFPGQLALGASSSATQVMPLTDLVGVLGNLQQMAEQRGVIGYQPTMSLCEQLNGLLKERHAAGLNQSVSDVDSNIIHLVSQLFEQALGRERLPERVSALLGRLQIPYVRIALSHPEFLTSPNHPARRLINDMATAGLALSEHCDEGGDSVYQKLNEVVHTLLQQDDDMTALELLANDFSAFIVREQRRVQMLAQRMAAVEEGKARLALARQEVAAALKSIVGDRWLPEAIVGLLDKVFYHYLCFIHHREGMASFAWQKGLLLVEQLLTYLLPVDSAEESEDRMIAIEELGNDIRRCAQEIKCQEPELDGWLMQMSSLLREQAVFDISPSEQDAYPDVHGERSADSGPLNTPADDAEDKIILIDRAERFRAPRIPVQPEVKNAQMKARLACLSVSPDTHEGSASAADIPALADDDPGLLKARELAVGALLQYSHNGERARCKLAAHIKSVERLIFVNSAGAKLFDKSLLEVAHDFNAGRLSVLEDSPLFDRALESVISTLRDVQVRAV